MNIGKPVCQNQWSTHTSALDEAALNMLKNELKDSAWESIKLQRDLKKDKFGHMDDVELRIIRLFMV